VRLPAWRWKRVPFGSPVSLNRYTYGWANPLRYWDPDGRKVLQGDGGPGTTEYYGVNNSTDYRKLMEIRALAALKEIGLDLVGHSWLAGTDSEDTLNRLVTAAAAAAPYVEIDYTLSGAALEELTWFLAGHGALPEDWGEVTDEQRVRYYTWTLLSSTGNTDLSYQQWKALPDWAWYLTTQAGEGAALERVHESACDVGLRSPVCRNKGALIRDVVALGIGAVTAYATVPVLGLTGTFTRAFASGSVTIGTASGWSQLMATGDIDAGQVFRDALIGGGITAGVSVFGSVVRSARTAWATRGATNTIDGILPKPVVSNPKLKNIVNDLYKGTTNPGRVGTGTTADAVRNELATGLPTGGTFHSEKARMYINGLTNVLKADLSASDRLVAQSLFDDLVDALGAGS